MGRSSSDMKYLLVTLIACGCIVAFIQADSCLYVPLVLSVSFA